MKKESRQIKHLPLSLSLLCHYSSHHIHQLSVIINYKEDADTV